jgi:1-deoxy-D-xylulose-5-phosphate synthase
VFVRRDTEKDADTCIAFSGGLYPQALEAADLLASRGITADLYNLRFLKPVDEDYLASILNRYRLIVFAEEGLRRGGFGEYVLDLASRRRCSAEIRVLGAADAFYGLGTREELLRQAGLDGPGIVSAVCSAVSPASVQ